MNIPGSKTRLRALEEYDAELLRRMLNDPSIERRVGGWGFPVSMIQQQQWLAKVHTDEHTKRFMIDTTDTDKPQTIGMIYLTNIDWKNRCVESGIKLASDAPRRQGYATDAVRALFRYAFDELQMHRIEMEILDDNTASKKLYEKCGARQEGVKREAVYKGGRYIDQCLYAVLKRDFKENE